MDGFLWYERLMNFVWVFLVSEKYKLCIVIFGFLFDEVFLEGNWLNFSLIFLYVLFVIVVEMLRFKKGFLFLLYLIFL